MLAKILSVAALAVASVSAHMDIISPCPRYSSRGQNCPALPAGQSMDYSMSSPLGANEPLCKHTVPFPTPCATWTAGQPVTVTFAPGGAPHGGGHCEFSLSYDGGNTFVVVYQILGTCFGASQGVRQYTFGLPAGLPSSDKVVFAWTWVNAIGNREFYMNCADVAIKGGSAPYTGKQMTIANHNGYPTIPEFSGNSNTGAQYYNNATTITVSGNGGSGGGQYGDNTPVAHTPAPPASYTSRAPATPTIAKTKTATPPAYTSKPTAQPTPAEAYSKAPPVVYSTAPQPTTKPGPVEPTALPPPYSTSPGEGAASGSCSDPALRCSPSGGGYQYCLRGSWSPSYSCAPGTVCKASGSSISCDWP